MSIVPQTPRKTPFHDATAELGAQFSELFGSLWPEQFGDLDAEYRAQRTDVGVMDASPINKWDFRGPDATIAAQRVHTNDILGEAIGQVRYGAFCNEDGLMIDDGTVFKLAEDHLWVMTNKDSRADHFADATRGLDVEITLITEQLPHLFFQGPRSRDALRAVTDADVDALRYFRFLPEPVEVAGVPVWLSRTGVSGELGFEFFCRADDAPELLRNVVKLTGARPYGLASIEPVRIEAGVIVTDTDYPENAYTPYDVSFDRLVNLEREFLGRDRLREVEPKPRRRRLTTLALLDHELPDYGTPLSHHGEPGGVLTSPTRSPLAGPIALAVVDAALTAPGTELELAGGGAARVHSSHPAYDPDKKRPRI